MTLYFVNSASILRAAGVDGLGVAIMINGWVEDCGVLSMSGDLTEASLYHYPRNSSNHSS
jgi:hypothetical protein